jgi:hypothetical protein
LLHEEEEEEEDNYGTYSFVQLNEADTLLKIK